MIDIGDDQGKWLVRVDHGRNLRHGGSFKVFPVLQAREPVQERAPFGCAESPEEDPVREYEGRAKCEREDTELDEKEYVRFMVHRIGARFLGFQPGRVVTMLNTQVPLENFVEQETRLAEMDCPVRLDTDDGLVDFIQKIIEQHTQLRDAPGFGCRIEMALTVIPALDKRGHRSERGSRPDADGFVSLTKTRNTGITREDSGGEKLVKCCVQILGGMDRLQGTDRREEGFVQGRNDIPIDELRNKGGSGN